MDFSRYQQATCLGLCFAATVLVWVPGEGGAPLLKISNSAETVYDYGRFRKSKEVKSVFEFQEDENEQNFSEEISKGIKEQKDFLRDFDRKMDTYSTDDLTVTSDELLEELEDSPYYVYAIACQYIQNYQQKVTLGLSKTSPTVYEIWSAKPSNNIDGSGRDSYLGQYYALFQSWYLNDYSDKSIWIQVTAWLLFFSLYFLVQMQLAGDQKQHNLAIIVLILVSTSVVTNILVIAGTAKGYRESKKYFRSVNDYASTGSNAFEDLPDTKVTYEAGFYFFILSLILSVFVAGSMLHMVYNSNFFKYKMIL